MNNSSRSLLAVHSSFPKKKLGRYRQQKGYFIIRMNEEILYVGKSKNIYMAIYRLYEKGGLLCHLNMNRAVFEVVYSDLRTTNLKRALITELNPFYNQRKEFKRELTQYHSKQNKIIIKDYWEQSRFERLGNHKTDNQPPSY